MAQLYQPHTDALLENAQAIQAYLKQYGIVFDQWQANTSFAPDASAEAVLAAYEHCLTPFMQQGGYQSADVVCVHPKMPGLEALREKFLAEHTHSEDEIRFFVEGEGYFWFHLPCGTVLAIRCQAGDLLSVPAGVKHWFDIGPMALLKAIRIFTDTQGWTPHYTNSGTEKRYRWPGKVKLVRLS